MTVGRGVESGHAEMHSPGDTDRPGSRGNGESSRYGGGEALADRQLATESKAQPESRPAAPPSVSDRERFLVALYNDDNLPPDAIVVLCGEDGEPRVRTALGLFSQAVGKYPTKIVISGGVHEPPRILGAAHLRKLLVGKGVAHSAVILEERSTNTREQAVNVTRIVKQKGWQRVTLVASSYHLPRAFLTFVQAFDEARIADKCRIIPYAAGAAARFGCPAGMEKTRMELLGDELAKVESYREMGHVATFARGLEYLQAMEGR